MLAASRTATGRRKPNPWYHETFGPIRGRHSGWNENCVLQEAMQGSMRPCLTAVLLGVALLLAGNRGALGARPDAAQAFHIPDPLLGEFIRTAIDSNPSIQTAYARYRAALQRVPQQTALPDPALTFGRFLRSVETREGPQLSTLTLSQRFPWFGKLDLKGKIAIKRAAAQFRLFRAREREVAAGVKRAFYDVAYLDRALEIVREEQSLLDHYENLAQARYASGKGHQQEVIRIQAEISRTMSRLELLRQQRQSAAARLNSLSDQPPEKPVPRLQLPAPAKVEIHLEELYELGARHRQELNGAMARIEATEQGVELAKKSFWPDVTLSAGTVNVGGLPPQDLLPAPRPGGKNAYNLSVSINIPLRRHKYRAEVMEAAENLIAERSTYRDLRNRIQLSIRDLAVRIQTLWRQMDLFERVLIPQTREALRSAESGYRNGQLGALELLDSERSLLETQVLQARYEADYMQALAEMEQAVGTRYPGPGEER